MRLIRLGQALLPFAAIALLAPASAASDSAFPVSIENCGVLATYARAPERAFTMNQAATEIMLVLGLHDRMVGTAFLDDAILPELADAYETIGVRAVGYPSREMLLEVKPDFVYAAYASAFSDDVPGIQDVLRSGAGRYLSPSSCGGRAGHASMELVFDEIRDIGRIFGVLPRAEQVIERYRAELDVLRERIGEVGTPRRVLWWDSAMPPFVGACCGAPGEILRLVGAENIFSDRRGSWATVSWEDVTARNPDVIVLVDASWAPAAEKRQWLLADRTHAGIAAVADERIVTVGFSDSTPGIRNIAAARRLAEALYPAKFAKPSRAPALARNKMQGLPVTGSTSTADAP